MLEHVEDQAKILHAKEIVLHVQEDNEDGIEWYTHRGFTNEGLQENYYPKIKPSGAYLLKKQVQ